MKAHNTTTAPATKLIRARLCCVNMSSKNLENDVRGVDNAPSAACADGWVMPFIKGIKKVLANLAGCVLLPPKLLMDIPLYK